MKKQVALIIKEHAEQRDIMNSLMMMPKKAEYLVTEAKKELVKMMSKVKVEYESEMKELKSYMQTLHTDISASVYIVKQLSLDEKRQTTKELVTNLSLDVSGLRKRIDENENILNYRL